MPIPKRQGTSWFEPETFWSAVENSTTELNLQASCSMAPLKFKGPTFPQFFLFFFVLVAALQQALTISYCIGGSVVGFSPATRETGVQFPTMHLRSSVVKVCHANYVMKVDVTFTGYRSLKGRGHLGLNRRPFDLKSKALPLSSIPVQIPPWLLQNTKHISPFFFIFLSC